VASSSRKRQARSVEADADVPKRKKAKVGRSRKRQARSKDEEEKKDVIESDDEPICKKIRVMPVNDRLNAHLTHLNGQKKAETKEFLGMLQEFRIHGEISAEKVCPIVFLDCCMSFFLLFPPPQSRKQQWNGLSKWITDKMNFKHWDPLRPTYAALDKWRTELASEEVPRVKFQLSGFILFYQLLPQKYRDVVAVWILCKFQERQERQPGVDHASWVLERLRLIGIVKDWDGWKDEDERWFVMEEFAVLLALLSIRAEMTYPTIEVCVCVCFFLNDCCGVSSW